MYRRVHQELRCGVAQKAPSPRQQVNSCCIRWCESFRLSYFQKCLVTALVANLSLHIVCGVDKGQNGSCCHPNISLDYLTCWFISLTIFVQAVVVSWHCVWAPSPRFPWCQTFPLTTTWTGLALGNSLVLFRAFGAPGHIRVSYGSLPEAECLPAVGNLAEGLLALASEADATASTKNNIQPAYGRSSRRI